MEYNIYFIIIFATVFVFYKLNLITEMLNLKALKNDLPKEFNDIYDEDEYTKNQEYTRTRTTFGVTVASINMVVFLCFWLMGGFGFLNTLLSGISSDVLRGVVYIIALSAGSALISLPIDIYSTFVIEERFGFNKSTPKTFVLDLLKNTGVSLVFGVPILAAILWIFGNLPMAWLWALIVSALFSLFMVYIHPAWIAPLYNKFEPLKDGELKDSIFEMAEKCKYSVKELYEMDGSKRSTKSNAYFTGLGKNKKIALFDTLIEKHTVPELVAVLAHEIGHFKLKHITKMFAVGLIQMGITFYLIGFFIGNGDLVAAFGIKGEGGEILSGKAVPVYLSLIFFFMLYKPIGLLTSILGNVMSRKHEFEADAYAADVTGNAEEMVSALKKLSKDNLANLTPHPFHTFLNASHPPILERIEALRAKSS